MVLEGNADLRTVAQVSDSDREFLNEKDCQALFARMVDMMRGGGDLHVSLINRWSGLVRWSRNRVSVAADLRTTDVRLTRRIRGASATVQTLRVDDEGLRETMAAAESSLRVIGKEEPEFKGLYDYVWETEPLVCRPELFKKGTYDLGADTRTDLVRQLIEPAEAAGRLSAGTLRISADGNATMSTGGLFRYYPTTGVEYSINVRDPKGTASGWAGVTHNDFGRIDVRKLAATALDKCIRSESPMAIEPGRYTTILEPQATADLFGQLLLDRVTMLRGWAEMKATVFSSDRDGWTRISERVLDDRLTMSADPMDPDGGFIPYERHSGFPYGPVTWIKQGILKELAYDRDYALQRLRLYQALRSSTAFRLAADDPSQVVSVEQMIANTQRGIYVTRFYDVKMVHRKSMSCVGYTRDGLWLIENGKVSRPVKNFRFGDSPMFILNSLLDVGPTIRVYSPGHSWMAPFVRVRDFNFTGLSDAV